MNMNFDLNEGAKQNKNNGMNLSFTKSALENKKNWKKQNIN